MFRFGLIVIALLLATAMLGNPVVSGKSMEEEVMCVPMGHITLAPPANVEGVRPAVEFPHAQHFGVQCQTCHHQWKGQDYIQGCMTTGCHDLTESPLKTKTGERPSAYYKNAYHKMCIGCHKATQMENRKLEASGKLLKDQLPKTGPTGCGGCHAE